MEKNLTVKPYDVDVIDELTSILLWKDMPDRGDGMLDIPAATLQLGINILCSAKYYAEDIADDFADIQRLREAIVRAIGILEHLRDAQKIREWNRRNEK